MHLLHPDFTFNRPEDISPAFLKERGIQGLLLDLDGTLCATGSYPPRESVGRWLSEVRSSGVDLAMVSNNRNMSRVEQFCMDHGILHYTGRAGKPGNRGFRWACEVLRLEPRALAVVGDQIFTDVLGGNRAGMKMCIRDRK